MVISKKWACVGVLVIAAVALSLPASAVVVLEDPDGELTGTGAVKHIGCHAVVDLTGSLYTYTYLSLIHI